MTINLKTGEQVQAVKAGLVMFQRHIFRTQGVGGANDALLSLACQSILDQIDDILAEQLDEAGEKPIEEIDAELRLAGVDLEKLERDTLATVRRLKREMNARAVAEYDQPHDAPHMKGATRHTNTVRG